MFQLPYVPFPEGYPDTPVGDQVATYATKYEPLRGYLNSSTLRWSYGAIKGRPDDWAAQLAGQPLAFVVPAVSAAGFDGIWVDPAGFEPAKALRIRTALRELLSEAPLVSPDRNLWFFDLRRYRAQLAAVDSSAQLALLRERVLNPLRTGCARGGVALLNPSASTRGASLTVQVAGGAVHRQILVPPGRSVAGIAGRVLYATLTDDDVLRFVRARRGSVGALVAGLTGPPCPG